MPDAVAGVQQLAESTYTVVPGDTLWNIAQQLGVDLAELYALNREVIGPDPDQIQPGMRLLVPGSPLAQLRAASVAPAESTGADAAPDGRIEQAQALTQSDDQLARSIDERVLAGTGLAGQGATIVGAAREYGVPVDFVLAMLRKESSFLSPENDLSIANNNPANLRFADWETEHGGAEGTGGFTHFPSIADGIRAQIHLLSRDPYAGMVARRDWEGVVYRWAPPSDGNDSALYARQMYEYSAEYRALLGIGEDWVGSGAVTEPSGASPSATVSDPATGTTWISQAQGQATQWEDCGPAAVVMALLARGITPRGWDPANPGEAIEQVRVDMGLERGTLTGGTNEGQVAAVLRSYGIEPTQTGDFDEMMTAVEQGRPLVLAGNTRTLPYATNVKDPEAGVDHFLSVVGYDPKTQRYGVYDPIAIEPGVKWLTRDEVYAFTDAPGQHRGVIG
jgi:LysM repeat protein